MAGKGRKEPGDQVLREWFGKNWEEELFGEETPTLPIKKVLVHLFKTGQGWQGPEFARLVEEYGLVSFAKAADELKDEVLETGLSRLEFAVRIMPEVGAGTISLEEARQHLISAWKRQGIYEEGYEEESGSWEELYRRYEE